MDNDPAEGRVEGVPPSPPALRPETLEMIYGPLPVRVQSRATFHENGNAWAIMARVSEGLKRAGATREERDEYMRDSMSGDYDHLLRTAMRYTAPDVVKIMLEMMASAEEFEERLKEVTDEQDG